jgi:tetratricopeptide (TPR) repeat protein
MSSRVDAFKVFIASPGGLKDERSAVRDEIRSFSDSFMHEYGVAFSTEGWEDVPGGMRRAQAAINEVVEGCDYMILILGSRWGTSPTKDGKFTSGTEEEFYLASECIERTDSPMADILVLFKGVPEEQLSDPGEQLSKVLEFKKLLEDSKEIFHKTFDDLISLRQEVSIRLRGWARTSSEETSTPGGLGPHDRRTRDTRPASPESEQNDSSIQAPAGASALQVAEEYEAKGLMTQAEAAYAKAIVDPDVRSLEKYARFLRRTGRLRKSLEVNHRVLDQLASGDDSTKNVAERARILTSIGIVERKLGDLHASRYSLREAVETAREGGANTLDALAYSLDNLGITASRSGESSQATDYFAQALAARKTTGDIAGQGRTLTNLARLYKRSGDIERAKRSCAEAINLLQQLDERSALASAYAAMGEILELESDLIGAEKSYRVALTINEALGMPDNIAMSLIQVARILIDRGDLVEAERFAQRAFEENERTSNREGTTASTHLLGRILGQTEREALAVGLLEDAISSYAAMGNPNGEGWARFHLAELQRRSGHDAEAAQSMESVRSLADLTGNAQLLALVVEGS